MMSSIDSYTVRHIAYSSNNDVNPATNGLGGVAIDYGGELPKIVAVHSIGSKDRPASLSRRGNGCAIPCNDIIAAKLQNKIRLRNEMRDNSPQNQLHPFVRRPEGDFMNSSAGERPFQQNTPCHARIENFNPSGIRHSQNQISPPQSSQIRHNNSLMELHSQHDQTAYGVPSQRFHPYLQGNTHRLMDSGLHSQTIPNGVPAPRRQHKEIIGGNIRYFGPPQPSLNAHDYVPPYCSRGVPMMNDDVTEYRGPSNSLRSGFPGFPYYGGTGGLYGPERSPFVPQENHVPNEMYNDHRLFDGSMHLDDQTRPPPLLPLNREGIPFEPHHRSQPSAPPNYAQIFQHLSAMQQHQPSQPNLHSNYYNQSYEQPDSFGVFTNQQIHQSPPIKKRRHLQDHPEHQRYDQLLRIANKQKLFFVLEKAAESDRERLRHTVARLLEDNLIDNSMCLLQQLLSSNISELNKKKIISVLKEHIWGLPPELRLWKNYANDEMGEMNLELHHDPGISPEQQVTEKEQDKCEGSLIGTEEETMDGRVTLKQETRASCAFAKEGTRENHTTIMGEITDKIVDNGEDLRNGSADVKQETRSSCAFAKVGTRENHTTIMGEITDNIVDNGEDLRNGSADVKQETRSSCAFAKVGNRENHNTVIGEIADNIVDNEIDLRNGSADVKQETRSSCAFAKVGTRENNTTVIGEITDNIVDNEEDLRSDNADVKQETRSSCAFAKVGTRENNTTVIGDIADKIFDVEEDLRDSNADIKQETRSSCAFAKVGTRKNNTTVIGEIADIIVDVEEGEKASSGAFAEGEIGNSCSTVTGRISGAFAGMKEERNNDVTAKQDMRASCAFINGESEHVERFGESSLAAEQKTTNNVSLGTTTIEKDDISCVEIDKIVSTSTFTALHEMPFCVVDHEETIRNNRVAVKGTFKVPLPGKISSFVPVATEIQTLFSRSNDSSNMKCNAPSNVFSLNSNIIASRVTEEEQRLEFWQDNKHYPHQLNKETETFRKQLASIVNNFGKDICDFESSKNTEVSSSKDNTMLQSEDSSKFDKNKVSMHKQRSAKVLVVTHQRLPTNEELSTCDCSCKYNGLLYCAHEELSPTHIEKLEHNYAAKPESVSACTFQPKEVNLSQEEGVSLSQQEVVSLSHEKDLSLSQQEDLSLSQQEDLSLSHEEAVSLSHEEDVSLSHEEAVSLSHEEDVSFSQQDVDMFKCGKDDLAKNIFQREEIPADKNLPQNESFSSNEDLAQCKETCEQEAASKLECMYVNDDPSQCEDEDSFHYEDVSDYEEEHESHYEVKSQFKNMQSFNYSSLNVKLGSGFAQAKHWSGRSSSTISSGRENDIHNRPTFNSKSIKKKRSDYRAFSKSLRPCNVILERVRLASFY